jgi:hypothetical protein
METGLEPGGEQALGLAEDGDGEQALGLAEDGGWEPVAFFSVHLEPFSAQQHYSVFC